MLSESRITNSCGGAAGDASACAAMGEGDMLLDKGYRQQGHIAEPCRFDFVPLTKLIGYPLYIYLDSEG